MFREYGGYLPLETGKKGDCRFQGESAYIQSLNSGRTAIAFAAKAAGVKKLLIPYYNCHTVADALKQYRIDIEYYFLDNDLEPLVEGLKPGEWLLYVNYLGNRTWEEQEALYRRYQRVIFDNAQAFFTPPVLGRDSYNVYSCRKFVGVSDGAYLVYSRENEKLDIDTLPQDSSWSRAGHMLRCLEEGTNAAYGDFLINEDTVGREIQRMSALTERILQGIDYETVRKIRRQNLDRLKSRLESYNCLPFQVSGEDLMMYPFYFEREGLRQELIRHHIYVPCYWKELLSLTAPFQVEMRLSSWLYPLPIDQRYSVKDMDDLADLVIQLLQS